MKIVLAPNFKIAATLVEISPENIVGFPKHLSPDKDEEVIICPFPMPIAREVNGGMYEFITPMEWLADVEGVKFSAIACLCIPSDVDKTLARDASVLINIVHANRTQRKPCDLVKILLSNCRYHEIVRGAYNFDPIKKLPSLIGAHAINKRTIRRITRHYQHTMAKQIWDKFQRQNPEAWNFEKIVNSFENKKKINDRLVYLILKNPSNLEDTWKKVKGGLIRSGLYHG